MRCDQVRAALAVTRDEGETEVPLREHLEHCAPCRALRDEYLRQDDLLRSLPVLRPSPLFRSSVQASVTSGERGTALPRWARATAGVLLALLVLTFGAVSAADGSLPGEALYALKRSAEEVRLVLTPGLEARAAYSHALRARRLEEVRSVVALGIDAEVTFAATLVDVTGAEWLVGGLPVEVDSDVWPGQAPPAGALVRVEARVQNGRVRASQVHVEPEPAGASAPDGPGQEVPAAPTPLPEAPASAPSPSDAPDAGPSTGRDGPHSPPPGAPGEPVPARPGGAVGGPNDAPGRPDQAPGAGQGGARPLPSRADEAPTEGVQVHGADTASPTDGASGDVGLGDADTEEPLPPAGNRDTESSDETAGSLERGRPGAPGTGEGAHPSPAPTGPPGASHGPGEQERQELDSTRSPEVPWSEDPPRRPAAQPRRGRP